MERVGLEAEEKHLLITFAEYANNATIPADSGRMAQVLLNLLINAVRYTPEGGQITITLGEEEPPSPRHSSRMLVIRIQDTGPGVAPEHLPYLFNRFYRTDEARSRHAGGMGLGLAIAKEFVASHRGSLTAESRPGEGTAFIVKLPFATDPA
ncbi:sensor histidine kinase [Paenibacillus macerans]|uniref:sensor histidine kinase n=1 Tax=Paenibacillus macerans TaxID=44252 RepID=UPI003D310CAF